MGSYGYSAISLDWGTSFLQKWMSEDSGKRSLLTGKFRENKTASWYSYLKTVPYPNPEKRQAPFQACGRFAVVLTLTCIDCLTHGSTLQICLPHIHIILYHLCDASSI